MAFPMASSLTLEFGDWSDADSIGEVSAYGNASVSSGSTCASGVEFFGNRQSQRQYLTNLLTSDEESDEEENCNVVMFEGTDALALKPSHINFLVYDIIDCATYELLVARKISQRQSNPDYYTLEVAGMEMSPQYHMSMYLHRIGNLDYYELIDHKPFEVQFVLIGDDRGWVKRKFTGLRDIAYVRRWLCHQVFEGIDLDDIRVLHKHEELEDDDEQLRYVFNLASNIADPYGLYELQVMLRGGGGGKRKFEDVMQEVNDKVVKIASKMSADNQFKTELDVFFKKLESNSSGTPIADIVRNMNPDEFQSLYGNYWNDTQANFLRFVPNIAENLTPLMTKIVETETDASDARQALCATLCGFFAKEFNNGKEVKNSIFEDILENQKSKHEEDQRVEARAQQLILERQNASSNGDVPMNG